MMLTYGFNHAEATRSFREAARLDPNCAMAYWGMALVLGPNINMAMPPEAEPLAYEMIQKAIAAEVLAGELAAKHGEYDNAIARLHRAILLEDNLIYNEPPDWHVPVRQSLGAVLLEAGRFAEAESIYWQDLSRNRENGWSLFGLMESLLAQGKEEQAAAIEERFKKAWSRADVTLTASRFIGESNTTMAEAGAATFGN